MVVKEEQNSVLETHLQDDDEVMEEELIEEVDWTLV